MQLRLVLPPLGSALRNRRRIAGALILAGGGAELAGATPPPQDVSVLVTGLRSNRGQVMACLTADAARFPDCGKDPAAAKLAVPVRAGGSLMLDFGAVPPGHYAVSIFHDENGNGKLDKMLMLPSEGFGFSRDAPVRMGPPKFDAAAFDVTTQDVRQTIRMRYML